MKHCGDGFAGISSLETMEGRLKGYVDSLDVLKGRIRNTIDLVSEFHDLSCYQGHALFATLELTAQIAYTLNLVVQDSASETNTHLLNLTQDTVDDSATVKIITIVSAIYLPGSFVSVSNVFNDLLLLLSPLY